MNTPPPAPCSRQRATWSILFVPLVLLYPVGSPPTDRNRSEHSVIIGGPTTAIHPCWKSCGHRHSPSPSGSCSISFRSSKSVWTSSRRQIRDVVRIMSLYMFVPFSTASKIHILHFISFKTVYDPSVPDRDAPITKVFANNLLGSPCPCIWSYAARIFSESPSINRVV